MRIVIKSGGGVYPSAQIYKFDFEQIIITAQTKKAISQMVCRLKNVNISDDKILILIENAEWMYEISSQINLYDELSDARVCWLREYANYINFPHVEGSVAECGVYMGDFSFYIKKFFSSRKFYLFDTFDGFNQKDIDKEIAFNDANFIASKYNCEHCLGSNLDLVRIVNLKLHNTINCEIRKGFFPDTAIGLDENFVFVNLDMDLYAPMYAGLLLFYPLMIDGGVILLHDYFNPELFGTKRAVDDVEKLLGIHFAKTPIGDNSSIAIIKH